MSTPPPYHHPSKTLSLSKGLPYHPTTQPLLEDPEPVEGTPAKPPLTVAHVVLCLDVGGLERVVLDLVREGVRRGQTVAVICLERPGLLAQQAEAAGGRVVSLDKPPGLTPGLVTKLRSIFRELRPDVVHTHQIGALLYAGPAARREGVPVVVHTEHGNHIARLSTRRQRLRARLLWWFAVRYAQRFFCVSEDIVAAARGLVRKSKLQFVANGIDTAAFADRSSREAVRRELGIPPDALVIGTVGRLNEVKRQDLLIRAFARVSGQLSVVSGRGEVASGELLVASGPEEVASGQWRVASGEGPPASGAALSTAYNPLPFPTTPPPHDSARAGNWQLTTGNFPDLRLLLVGDGPQRPALEALVAELGIGSRVIFAGYQAQPQRMLHAMDVFALTSRTEGMPLAILEAWAAGLPVIASRVGGVPKLIDPEKTGLLFESGDEAGLVAGLVRLLEDAELAKRLGEAGRRCAVERFDTRRMAGDYESEYRGCLSTKGTKGHEGVGK